MAYRDHPQVKLHDGDTVVFSATPIPGNERAVNDTIDRLYHIGCEVITTRDAPIHASGHGYTEELKLMLNLTKPRYVMPFHGDFKRIQLRSQLAEAVGDRQGGDLLRRERAAARASTPAARASASPSSAGMIFVDGVNIGDRGRGAARPTDALRRTGSASSSPRSASRTASWVADPEVIFAASQFLDEAGH